MDSQRFRELSPRHRALVAVAVLLDGRDASLFLDNDAAERERLKQAAVDVSNLPPELRMPFAGSALRAALKELK